MARQTALGEWACPCTDRGLQATLSCPTCGGRGYLNYNPHTVAAPGVNPLNIATDGRLWAIGLRNTAVALCLLIIAAGLLGAVMIVSTWWMAAPGLLRSAAQTLPASWVARTPDDSGAPWVIFALLAALALVVFLLLTRPARRASSRFGRLGWTTTRALLTVLALGLAVAVAGIAAGADLAEPATTGTYLGLSAQAPTGFTGQVLPTDSLWALGWVTGVVLLWGGFSAWRLHRRWRERQSPIHPPITEVPS
ncbi:hypothetical protein [Zhihengliuella flava]|uniref:Uncharacterized protein n=1 Tax=Zhihengliuella flava TaxID=1285193 RepID=A0A931D4S9_9MICC|nr:hypothetical protein [Zhihengliuella flava]MBG6084419.1 hypothetical protein [Zhihengliuella flava]